MFIVVVVATLLTIQWFLKGSIMGRWRSVADAFGFGRQYEPGQTTGVGVP